MTGRPELEEYDRFSLYVHFPFCLTKCRYCDFFSVPGQQAAMDPYLEAVAREWELRTGEIGGEPRLASLYLGGGTPSLLSVKQWERFHRVLLGRLPLAQGVEFSVECNPESFSDEKAGILAEIGVNRLTFGVQTTDDRLLRLLDRRYSASLVRELLGKKVLDRFTVGVDIMYGLPGQSLESFSRTLHDLLRFPSVRHLSAYELNIGGTTPFGRHRSLLPLPDTDTVARMTDTLQEVARGYGFERYEISNFARPGFLCSHNSSYWDHSPYLGLGCAAHSFLHPRRFWNVRSIGDYLKKIGAGELPVEGEETIGIEDLAREMAFLGFRRSEGLDETSFEKKTGMRFVNWAGEHRLRSFLESDLLMYRPPRWIPTARGMLFADYIARELF